MRTGIILAAGKSTRMYSDIPKVLHKVWGKTLLDYTYESVRELLDEIIVVGTEQLKDYWDKSPFVIQEQQLGTGHAVLTALEKVNPKTKDILVLYADTPLIRKITFEKMLASHASIVLTGFELETFHRPYGKIHFNEDGNIVGIIEHKEEAYKFCSSNIANAGLMKISYEIAKKYLPELTNINKSGEYYLTDLIQIADCSKSIILGEEEEFFGVNTRDDLVQAQKLFQDRWIAKFIQEGVMFEDPDSVFLSHDTQIEKDAIICPHVYFGPNVTIKTKAKIMPFVCISDATIEESAEIGPFCHIRGGSVIESNAQIGNFVEVKKSTIGKNSKAKHLAYIGDTTIGTHSNIGAGAVTVNYDGQNKFKTKIGNNVMVGCNSSLIAPIELGDNSYVGAGSVINHNVDPGDLAITRSEEKRIKGWDKRKKRP